MKTTIFTAAALCSAMSAMATVAPMPNSFDITKVLQKDANLSLGLLFPGECAQHGAVVDVNGDGIDDFIISGLYAESDAADAPNKGFLRVYFGVESGTPKLVYDNLEFSIAGNGSMDAYRKADGTVILGVQGGSLGNWTNPFKLNIYSVTAEGEAVNIEEITNYQGLGRGSLLFFDINGDNHMDFFQNGWTANADWSTVPGIYYNDGTEWWDEQFYDAGLEPIRPSANSRAVKGDVNNDGKMDVLLPIQGKGLFLYTNNGDGTFKETLIAAYNKEDRTDGVAYRNEDDASEADFIDFNNDGKLDIVSVGTNDQVEGTTDWSFIMELYKNNGDGTFSLIEQKNFEGNATTLLGGQRADLAIADFNCDGNMDIILGAELQTADAAGKNTWECSTFWMPGNGKGGFDQFNVTYDSENNPNGIVAMSRRANFGQFLVGDFNGDKKPDLVTIGTNYYAKNGDLRFYANQSKGEGSVESLEGASAMKAYVAGDMLYVETESAAEVSVYAVNGAKVAGFVANGNCAEKLNVEPGIYVVKVQNGSDVATSKVVVK